MEPVHRRFPGGTYDQGTGGNGPGLYQLLADGSYAGGLDPTDPEFNILRATGHEGITASVTTPGEAVATGNPAAMIDGVLRQDPERTGWYDPIEDGDEIFQVDLGLSDQARTSRTRVTPKSTICRARPTWAAPGA